MDAALWGLVLAGGDGRRLEDVTRLIAGAPIPKQYCRLVGGRSLLEETLDRIAPLVPPHRTVVVVNRSHLPLAEPQLLRLPGSNVVIQPANLDTGPGLVLGVLAIARLDPAALVAVFPSDHYVANAGRFLAHVGQAAGEAVTRRWKIVLLGVEPDRPDPGLGYVEPGRRVSGAQARHVAAFHEKPPPDRAAALIGRGALWNSFIMVFRVDAMLRLVARTRPRDLDLLRREGTRCYAGLEAWSFSHDFLARAVAHLVVLPMRGTGWSDWGTREAIERTCDALRQPPPWRAAETAA